MTGRQLRFAVLIALMTVTTGLACQTRVPEPEIVQQPEYLIGPEDVLNIVVWNNAALSSTVQVRPDGMISLPLVNDVQAEGLTPMALQEVLRKKLTDFLPSPEVSVIINDVRSFNVTVIGEVGKVGRLNLKSRTTVLEALALAGGFTPFASKSGIVILRHEEKTVKRIPFNYNKAIAEGGERENFYLKPGDIILVQ